MENLCIDCKKEPDVVCFCDKSLKYCYKHFGFIPSNYKEDHNFIDIQDRKVYIHQYYSLIHENLKRFQKVQISRSKILIETIETVTKSNLKLIKNAIKSIEKIVKTNEIITIKNLIEEYKTLDIKTSDLSEFIETINKNYSLYKNNFQILKTNDKFIAIENNFKQLNYKIKQDSKNFDLKLNELNNTFEKHFQTMSKTCKSSSFIIDNPIEEEKIDKSSQWKCECNTKNHIDWKICTNCEFLKPGLFGWLCKRCTYYNENQASLICETCEYKKDERPASKHTNCSICLRATENSELLCKNCRDSKEIDEKQQDNKNPNLVISNHLMEEFILPHPLFLHPLKDKKFLESKKKKENFDLKFCLICKNLISVLFCPHCKQSTSFTDTCDFCDGSLEKVKVCKKCIFESDMGLLELDGREVVCLFCGKIFSSGLVECPDCDKADV